MYSTQKSEIKYTSEHRKTKKSRKQVISPGLTIRQDNYVLVETRKGRYSQPSKFEEVPGS